ncbi:hypothetical protein TSAR_014157 [Trichomalopsis sarcophagae]|uniref:Uncharacterized protein n=1 Tax=Trichomalopsis sarcophagae TaxID=543379 RepID=A0A232EMS8_9HYME|nr:hypothetical protein TSAR_014157 [Trichomalopsis sarcophagae]
MNNFDEKISDVAVIALLETVLPAPEEKRHCMCRPDRAQKTGTTATTSLTPRGVRRGERPHLFTSAADLQSILTACQAGSEQPRRQKIRLTVTEKNVNSDTTSCNGPESDLAGKSAAALPTSSPSLMTVSSALTSIQSSSSSSPAPSM